MRFGAVEVNVGRVRKITEVLTNGNAGAPDPNLGHEDK
jgi:hypothetical protein